MRKFLEQQSSDLGLEVEVAPSGFSTSVICLEDVERSMLGAVTACLRDRNWNILREGQMLKGNFLDVSPGQLVETMSVTLGVQIWPPHTISICICPGGGQRAANLL